MISTRLGSQPFAQTTFAACCPSVPATASKARVLTSRRLAQICADSFSIPVVINPNFASRRRIAVVRFRPTWSR